jgi:hypothetical protein
LTDAEASAAASAQWVSYIDARILAVTKAIAEEVAAISGGRINKLSEQVQQIQSLQQSQQQKKIVLFDPSESLKKVVAEYSGSLREELVEIRKELGFARKGEVLDLPSLPERRRA